MERSSYELKLQKIQDQPNSIFNYTTVKSELKIMVVDLKHTILLGLYF